MADDAVATEGELSSSLAEDEATSAEIENDDAESPFSDIGDADATGTETADSEPVSDGSGAGHRGTPTLRPALVVGLITVLALGGLAGWLGYRTYQSQQTKNERALYLQVARQGALNLTTIDFQHADADIQRILDSATGQFHDDFASRSEPFVEVVKQAQSKSVGTITEAGLESVTGDEAQAIVAVSVNTSNAGAAEQPPRAWRMRLTVQKVGEDVKVSNVGFVS
ncbi:tetratricopeptide repeat protein [Mycobacterium sp. 21AC1]|uniref:mammalian cell entry protein n=1 Tax=[Mycobacterium] appelbergii TaxID=2939269 RepID=UPI002938F5A1|nr:mammalian cell entry protein [Mycobacterium sp. 21AC1]MDV3124474.1 tetratricopeptide repeat protein [Mycobacterium sp. 21AC1]